MPRDALSRDQIIQSAVDLLDAEGLDGLNMRALGQRLGVAPTAVYWHVKNKDDLVTLAGDRVWTEIAPPDPEGTGWRAAATAMATDLHAMFSRHPWLVQAFGTHLFYGEGKARYDDNSLAVFEAGGFTGAAADQAAGMMFTFVLGNVLGAAATTTLTRRLTRSGRDAEEEIAGAVAAATAIAQRFPRLRARLDTAATAYDAAPAQTFETGLRVLLAGLESERDRGRMES
ncbi:TetR/AcrR family transcriptional regulator [Actinoplanes rectilineatus]|uniref:TetR/AcrR family transcriptional regulator n=1 Tax=Actinoplanes rectilineatus TaxID=113571 RepID=UPI0005F2D99A|nr:TetR/AcrR family transcriptional regulator C-terminal domain-containing protein [Actinoplanes rectilineatus]